MSTDEAAPLWGTHDKNLARKLQRLFETRLTEWLGVNNGALHAEKWHVGREILKWLYQQGHLSADEIEALQLKYWIPKKNRATEFYRLIWKVSGRSSAEVRAICTAPQTGPSKGYSRLEPPLLNLVAQKEIVYGDGGWLYAYSYELAYKHSIELAQVPLMKVGHTSGDYKQRIADQVNATAVPDAPIVLRAYRVSDSFATEQMVHSRLVSKGCHHQKAGGTEWFLIRVDELDQVVSEVVKPKQN